MFTDLSRRSPWLNEAASIWEGWTGEPPVVESGLLWRTPLGLVRVAQLTARPTITLRLHDDPRDDDLRQLGDYDIRFTVYHKPGQRVLRAYAVRTSDLIDLIERCGGADAVRRDESSVPGVWVQQGRGGGPARIGTRQGEPNPFVAIDWERLRLPLIFPEHRADIPGVVQR